MHHQEGVPIGDGQSDNWPDHLHTVEKNSTYQLFLNF